MKVEVKNRNGYNQVIASEQITKGEIVFKLKGHILSNPNKYTIQLSEQKHIEALSSDITDINSSWKYINHSCEPNCEVDVKEEKIIALRNINPGEEITFDYNSTEKKMASPFICNCGSKKCIGEIRGSVYLKPHIQI